VAEDGAPADAGGVGDLIDRCLAVALSDEQLEGGLGDPSPGGFGLLITNRSVGHEFDQRTDPIRAPIGRPPTTDDPTVDGQPSRH